MSLMRESSWETAMDISMPLAQPPARTTSAKVTIGWVGHDPGTGIVDPPIVVNDIANPATNQVFSFTGRSNVVGIGGAVSQIPANFASATAFNTVDLGSAEAQVAVRLAT